MKKALNTDVVYIGGGTPNYLSCGQLEKLFLILKKYINLSKVKEFTIEINPASCDVSQLRLFKKYGVTRLSFGIQTLNKKILKPSYCLYKKIIPICSLFMRC